MTRINYGLKNSEYSKHLNGRREKPQSVLIIAVVVLF